MKSKFALYILVDDNLTNATGHELGNFALVALQIIAAFEGTPAMP